MARNYGATTITNADDRALTQSTYLAPSDQGGHEERIDRRPQGKVVRFVDKAGHIVSLQMFSPGDPARLATEQKMLAAYHAKGFIEHAKCPLKHGTFYKSPIGEKDLKKMPAELQSACGSDPKPWARRNGDLYAVESCPHVEWLIEHRRAQDQDARLKRNAFETDQKKAKEREDKLKALQLAKLEAELGGEIDEQPSERKPRKPKAPVVE